MSCVIAVVALALGLVSQQAGGTSSLGGVLWLR